MRGLVVKDRDLAESPLLGRLELLTVLGVVGVLALALGFAGLSNAGSTLIAKKIDYTQSGAFANSATAPATSAYGPSGLTTGEPIIKSLVGPVTMSFRYRLSSRPAARLHGVASMVVQVKVPQGLTREFPVAGNRSFEGKAVTLAGTLPLGDIASFVSLATAASGATGGPPSATVTLTPKIDLAGTVGGRSLRTSYEPALSFALSGSTLTLTQDESSAGSGAQAADQLNPSQPGTVDYKVRQLRVVGLFVAHPSSSVAMGVGFGVALLCLGLGFWLARPLMGDETTGESERIRALYASQLLPVRSLRLPDGPVAEVASMSALADLAKQYETKIMHLRGEGGDSYLLWDDGMLYRYGDGPETTSLPGTMSHPFDSPSTEADVQAGQSNGEGYFSRIGHRHGS